MVGRVGFALLFAPCLAGTACGPPSWPETAWPGELEADPATVFALDPADPIEGEEVQLVVPFATAGGCHAFGAVVRPEEGDGAAILLAEPASPDMCPVAAVSGVGSRVALGRLPAGAYVARAGELEVAFEVRPPSTSPGLPPLSWRAAHEVASAHHAGSGCGDDAEGAGDSARLGWRLRAPRLHHQVAAAHPDWDEARVEAAMCAAQAVTVRAVSERELRYRHFAGSLCHAAEAIGTVRVRDDGTLEVGEPFIVHGGDIDC